MNKQQASQFLKQINSAGPQGSLSAVLAGDEDRPNRKTFRVKVTYKRFNRSTIIGQVAEWAAIRQAWSELERGVNS